MLETDLHPSARSEGTSRGVEDVEVRPIGGREGLAVHRPGELLPVQTARQEDFADRSVGAVDQVEGPTHVIARPFGEEVEVQRHLPDVRDPGVAVRGQVLAPVVLLLLLGRAALWPPANFQRQPDTGDQGDHGPGRKPQDHRGGSPRSQPMHELGRVYLATAKKPYRHDGEEDRQTQGHDAVQDQGATIELQHAHVAIPDGLPQRPVADPVDLVGPEPVSREVDHSQGQRVGCIAALCEPMNGRYEGDPQQDGRQQEQSPVE